MPSLTLPLSSNEPKVDAILGVAVSQAEALRLGGLPVPSPRTAPALIDTGAALSCVDSKLVQLLGLQEVDETLIVSVGTGPTGVRIKLHEVSLRIAHPIESPADDFFLEAFPVGVATLAQTGVEILIGTDMLTEVQCLFLYDSRAGEFTLEW